MNVLTDYSRALNTSREFIMRWLPITGNSLEGHRGRGLASCTRVPNAEFNTRFHALTSSFILMATPVARANKTIMQQPNTILHLISSYISYGFTASNHSRLKESEALRVLLCQAVRSLHFPFLIHIH